MAPIRAVDGNGRASRESKNFIFIIIKVAYVDENEPRNWSPNGSSQGVVNNCAGANNYITSPTPRAFLGTDT